MRIQSVVELDRLLEHQAFPVGGLLVTPERDMASPIIRRITAALNADIYVLPDPSVNNLRFMQDSMQELLAPRVYLIEHAERLSRAAQIMLLKTTEEPPPNSTLVFVTEHLLGMFDILKARLWESVLPGTPKDELRRRASVPILADICYSWAELAEVERLELGSLWPMVQQIAEHLPEASLPNLFKMLMHVTKEQYAGFLKLLLIAYHNRLGQDELIPNAIELIMHTQYLLGNTMIQQDRLMESLILKLWYGLTMGFDNIPSVPGAW